MFAIPDLRGKPGYRNMTNFNHYMLQPLREGCSLIVIDESNTQPPLVNQIHKPPLVNQIHNPLPLIRTRRTSSACLVFRHVHFLSFIVL
jgi:hypothetical protein